MKKSAKSKVGKISPEDAALFRATVGTVEPLQVQNRITPQTVPRKILVDHTEAPAVIPDTLSNFAAEHAADDFLSNGLSRMTFRKLRRGVWPVQDSIDLHGYNSDAARKLLQTFLHEAAQRCLRCVLVIHGKGLNSQNGQAVLRKLTRHWLAQHRQVLAYCDATPRDGGNGAVLVLLKIGS